MRPRGQPLPLDVSDHSNTAGCVWQCAKGGVPPGFCTRTEDACWRKCSLTVQSLGLVRFASCHAAPWPNKCHRHLLPHSTKAELLGQRCFGVVTAGAPALFISSARRRRTSPISRLCWQSFCCRFAYFHHLSCVQEPRPHPVCGHAVGAPCQPNAGAGDQRRQAHQHPLRPLQSGGSQPVTDSDSYEQEAPLFGR